MNIVGSPPSNRKLKPGYAAPAVVFSLPQTGGYARRRVGGDVLAHRSPAPVEPSKNLVLRSLPADILRTLEPYLQPVSLKKQEILFHEDDCLDFVYFPGTAVISEFRMLEDGRIVEIAATGRDGAVGLSSLLFGSSRAPNTTRVSQPGTAERIPVWAFTALLKSNDGVRPSLNQFVDRYVRQISQKVICNMYHPAKARLCTWLLTAQDNCCSATITLTHDQISRILGVFRPTVTWIAQELRAEALISYSRGEISIHDRKGIERSACGCYLAPAWAPVN